MAKEIGKVVHSYDKVSAVAVKLTAALKVGDVISIKRGDSEFEQTVSSMQIEHEDITSAKKGQVIGIKVDQKTKEGALVYKKTAKE